MKQKKNKTPGRTKNILSVLCSLLVCALVASATPFFLVAFVVLIVGGLVLYFGHQESNILALVTCGLITKVQRPICANPGTNGIEWEIYIWNKSDVIGETFTGSTLVLEALTFDTGKKMYAYEGMRTSSSAKFESVEGKLNTTYKHTVEQFVFKRTGDTKAELEALCNGLVGVMIRNKYTGTAGDTAYEIYGYHQGLVGIVSQDSSDEEARGTFKLTLKTPEGCTEPHIPYAFYKTSLAATVALVTGYQV